MNFNPVDALEAAGINNFSIDYDRKTVSLDKRDLHKLMIQVFELSPIKESILVIDLVVHHGWAFHVGLPQ
ncbi:MAG TPA: hypothetical protein DDW87_11730 [Firmicutes bacterium]|nr:hypothetical protein [Bacillota bacterium]